MRKLILHLLLTIIITLVIGFRGYSFITWEYWIILICSNLIYLNAAV